MVEGQFTMGTQARTTKVDAIAKILTPMGPAPGPDPGAGFQVFAMRQKTLDPGLCRNGGETAREISARPAMAMRHRLLGMARGNKGFSLIELITVLILITVLTAIAVPNLSAALPSYRLRSAARDLYSAMQQAKMRAVMERRNWGIKFDLANNAYRLCAESGAAPSWAGGADDTDLDCTAAFVSLAGYRSGIRYGFGEAVNTADDPPVSSAGADLVTYGDDVIVFTPRGMTADGFCYLTNERGLAYLVGSRFTGGIMVRKWHGGAGWQ
jgi:prepilin-type N-terminal cleavage/methylation domain-containing protein